MKKQAVKAFVLVGFLFSLSAIYVYAKGNTLIGKVEIPFNFSVGDKTLPAGTYSVSRITQDKVVLQLRSEDGREVIRILTHSVQAKESPAIGKLSFHRYGETYFLFQIWEPDDNQGRQLPRSRTERSVQRDLAKTGEESSTVDLGAIAQ